MAWYFGIWRSARCLQAVAALLGTLCILVLAGCGVTSPAATRPTTPEPTPTTPLDATRCDQVYGLAGAQPLSIASFQFPLATVATARTVAQGASSMTVTEYRVCAPDGELITNPAAGSGGYPLGQIFSTNWQDSGYFPADGRHLTPCDMTMSGGYFVQQCMLLPTLVYAMIDQAVPQGQGLMVFRLRLAHPPHPCDATSYSPASGNGYPQAVSPLMPIDTTQVPVPPLTLQGTARIGFQSVDGGQAPYGELPLCTQGTRASILADMRTALSGDGWSPTSGDGSAWVLILPGSTGRIELRLTGLDTPQSWTILMGTRLDLPPPSVTTPQPPPDAIGSPVTVWSALPRST